MAGVNTGSGSSSGASAVEHMVDRVSYAEDPTTYKLLSCDSSDKPSFPTASSHMREINSAKDSEYDRVSFGLRLFADYMASGLRREEYAAGVEISAKYGSCTLDRSVNEHVAEAALLCQAMGYVAVAKSMTLKNKSNRDAAGAAGFIASQKGQSHAPSSTRRRDSDVYRLESTKHVREQEKGNELYTLDLQSPVFFIQMLHSQGRIERPVTGKDDNGLFIDIKTRGVNGESFKWRLRVAKKQGKANQNRDKVSSYFKNAHVDDVPDFFINNYISRLESEGKTKEEILAFVSSDRFIDDMKSLWKDCCDDKSWMSADFKAQLEAMTDEDGHALNLNDIVLDFNHVETDAKTGLTTEKPVEILGRHLNLGVGREDVICPVIADLDAFALVPNANWSNETIAELKADAGVDVNDDSVDHKFEKDFAIAVASRNTAKLAKMRRDYYMEVIDYDAVNRYKHDLTGFGTRAEGDLIAARNRLIVKKKKTVESRLKSFLSRLSQMVIKFKFEKKKSEYFAKNGRSMSKAEERKAISVIKAFSHGIESRDKEHTSADGFSMHHGADTSNPKPDPIMDQNNACFDPHGDHSIFNSYEDLVEFYKAQAKDDDLNNQAHYYPCNMNWRPEIVSSVFEELRDRLDFVVLSDGMFLLKQYSEFASSVLINIAKSKMLSVRKCMDAYSKSIRDDLPARVIALNKNKMDQALNQWKEAKENFYKDIKSKKVASEGADKEFQAQVDANPVPKVTPPKLRDKNAAEAGAGGSFPKASSRRKFSFTKRFALAAKRLFRGKVKGKEIRKVKGKAIRKVHVSPAESQYRATVRLGQEYNKAKKDKIAGVVPHHAFAFGSSFRSAHTAVTKVPKIVRVKPRMASAVYGRLPKGDQQSLPGMVK
jgi:hypothetical protein